MKKTITKVIFEEGKLDPNFAIVTAYDQDDTVVATTQLDNRSVQHFLLGALQRTQFEMRGNLWMF